MITFVKRINHFTAVILKLAFVYPFFRLKLTAEFRRITTVYLLSKFFSELEAQSSNLIKVFGKKGGVQGRKIKSIMIMGGK